jgi:yersiniabactin nonribosomal peptide/polyketide synthase
MMADRLSTEDDVVDAVRAIWADALSQTIDDDSDFFHQGGSSAAALAICARIEESFRVRPALRTLFEQPRFGDYVRAIRALVTEDR